MNDFTKLPTVVYTIKGTNLNKGRARTWIEKPVGELAVFGFSADMRVDIEFLADRIVVTANPDGKRKPTIRNGKMILDICYPDAQRAAMFNGAARLTVWGEPGRLIITA